MRRGSLLACAVAMASLTGAGPPRDAPYADSDFARVRKLDAHVHVNRENGRMLAVARRDGFDLLSIEVDRPFGRTLPQQAAIVHRLRSADPARVRFATAFPMAGFGTPGWTERTNRLIDREVAQGAVAVKVWKNIGMSARDAAGRRVFLDDPRFDGVMRHIEQLRLPLIAHQGEPRNCWLPLAAMTTENDRSYFREHPEYYMFLHPKEPGYETLMAHRDRFVARHPHLAFVGAHLASLEWSVDRLAAFLDRFPNADVDLAARLSNLQVQSNADYPKVRAFFIRYQDRLLYGSDLSENPPPPAARLAGDAFDREADDFWRSDWRYLATPLTQHVDAIGADTRGLALPRPVINKIYRLNALRVFGRRRGVDQPG